MRQCKTLIEHWLDRIAGRRLPVRQGKAGIETGMAKPVLQLVSQRTVTAGKVENCEEGQARHMADMGVTMVGECEGQFRKLRLPGAEGQHVAVEQAARLTVQSACSGRVAGGLNGHGEPHL